MVSICFRKHLDEKKQRKQHNYRLFRETEAVFTDLDSADTISLHESRINFDNVVRRVIVKIILDSPLRDLLGRVLLQLRVFRST